VIARPAEEVAYPAMTLLTGAVLLIDWPSACTSSMRKGQGFCVFVCVLLPLVHLLLECLGLFLIVE
jgi:hypothetical protein